MCRPAASSADGGRSGTTISTPSSPILYSAGPSIAGLRKPVNGDTTWVNTLLAAIDSVAEPINRQDMAALRLEVERIAGAHLLSGLPTKRLAAGSVSDLVHVNRVQGLAFGLGAQRLG